MPPETSSTLALACRTQFDNLSEAIVSENSKSTDLVSAQHVEQMQDRFRQWAGNLGAFQPSTSLTSLDCRLDNAPVAKGAMTGLLQDLQESLLLATDIVLGRRENTTEVESIEDLNPHDYGISSGDSDTDSIVDDQKRSPDPPASELKRLLATAKNTIDNLFKFSVFIRKTDTPNRRERAAKRREFDANADVMHIQDKYPRVSQKLAIQLGRANSQRRQYFKYCRDHHDRLSRTDTGAQEVQTLPEQRETVTAQEKNLPTSKIAPAPTINTKQTARSSLAETEATKLERDMNPGLSATDDQKSVTSMATSIIEITEGELGFPPMPPEANVSGTFICPYCWTAVALRPRDPEAQWRKHIISDLQPYICTFGCSSQTFSSPKEWFDHEMLNHRSRWVCPVCGKGLPCRQSLKRHVEQYHTDEITVAQLGAILDTTRRPLDEILAEDCLLCDGKWATVDHVHQQEFTGSVSTSPQDFRKHLGHHLLQIALFSLPRQQDDELSVLSRGSANSSQSSIRAASIISIMASRNRDKTLESPDLYSIAWITNLSFERVAALAVLDEQHAEPNGFAKHQNDDNAYLWGRVGEHNVVIASPPDRMHAARSTAFCLLSSLPSIRIALLVGIGGGISRPDQDIRLGDIAVSQPTGRAMGGVYQYDLDTGNTREQSVSLKAPPQVLLRALARIQFNHGRRDSKVPEILREMIQMFPGMAKNTDEKPGYIHQGFHHDRLFEASAEHTSGPDCQDCDPAGEVQRQPRDSTYPEIHYGIIASGSTVVNDAITRDRIVSDFGDDVICLMETAGLITNFPGLLIRGISDYADAHKNDRWQRYAAAAAAAYAKELLGYLSLDAVEGTEVAVGTIQTGEQISHQSRDEIHETKFTTETSTTKDHRRVIKSWLCPPDPSTNAQEARQRRTKGTGTWFLEGSAFREWKQGLRRHLWLYGMAGCGKTVLSSTILDHLSEIDGASLVYFFFDFANTDKQSVHGLLRSMAFQLYNQQPNASKHFEEALERGRDVPSTATLKDITFKMMAEQKKLLVLVDAVDNCTAISQLLQCFEDISLSPELQHVQLILTSRPEADLLREIPHIIGQRNVVELEKEQINSEIRSYVIRRLQEDDDFLQARTDSNLTDLIVAKIGEGANGMFRWATIQLDNLARQQGIEAMRQALGQLPPDLQTIYDKILGELAPELETTYDKMFSRIPVQRKKDATRLLQFLIYWEDSITLDEAVEIIATDIEVEPPSFHNDQRLLLKDDVLAYVPGFAFITEPTTSEPTRKVQIAHSSIQEYLRSQVDFDRKTADIAITTTCITYLTSVSGALDSFDRKGDLKSTLQHEFPFAEQAAKFWLSHAAACESRADAAEAVTSFMFSNQPYQLWRHLLEHNMESFWTSLSRMDLAAPNGFRLLYASKGNLLSTCERLIADGADINESTDLMASPLEIASKYGHKDVVALLLERGATVDPRNTARPSPLSCAATHGHMDVVRLLLGYGADINSKHGGNQHDNPLQAASASGHMEIVRILLDWGADVNGMGGTFGTALAAAATCGHSEVAKLLVDYGADVNQWSPGHPNTLPLQAACASGHMEIVRILLDWGANVNGMGGAFGTALAAAAAGGHSKVTKLLVAYGADVNLWSEGHPSALWQACKGLHTDLVLYLLEWGAEADRRYGEFSRPIVAAIQARSGKDHSLNPADEQKARLEIVQLLLERGAEPVSDAESSS